MEFNATLLAQIFHFVLLLIFLRVVAYKPIAKVLQDRQNYIANTIAAAEAERKQAEDLRKSYEQQMQKAKEQAQELIQQAVKQGEQEAQKIIEAAKQEANKVKESAMAEIEREKQKAMQELRDHVATLAVLVAGKVIQTRMTDQVQRELIDKFINEAGGLLQ